MLEKLEPAGLWGRDGAAGVTSTYLVCFFCLWYPSREKTLLVKGKQTQLPGIFFPVAFPSLRNENSSEETVIGFDTTSTAVMEAGFSAGQSDDLTSCLNEISKFKAM